MSGDDLYECAECSIKVGSPVLCALCRERRKAAGTLWRGPRPDRIGDWSQAASGRKFWPLDPRPEDVCLDDVAHALSLVNRFGGHLPWGSYSVAQHSVLVAQCVAEMDPNYALAALFHDAPEAYLGDVIRPLKRSGALSPVWFTAEHQWEEVFAKAIGFNVEYLRSEVVKTADNRLLLAEKRDLLNPCDVKWQESKYVAWEPRITPIDWLDAKTLFLATYERLRTK